MYFKSSLIAILSYVACCTAAASPETTTNASTVVSVFYETYCPDSIKFITKQFYPTYLQTNGSYFIPHLVPFGNANFSVVNNTVTFQCQHGEKECYGNKVHACVLSLQAPNLAAKLKFINCTLALTNSSLPYPTNGCALEAGLNVAEIDNCVNSSESSKYLQDYGNLTKSYNITSVPSVGYNSQFDQKLSEDSVKDFNSVLCEKFLSKLETKPEFCKSQKGSASTMSLTVLPVIFLTFLVSKMY